MKGDGWQTRRLSDLEPILAAGVHWKPPRRTLGIEAFGTNAYVRRYDRAEAPGTLLLAIGAKPGEPYVETLRRAEALDPRVREWVAKDADLASVRDRYFEQQP